MSFNVEVIEEKKRILKVGKNVAEKLGILHLQHSNIRFGLKVADVNIEIDANLGDDIHLAQSIVHRLNLPVDCTYNIAVSNNELVIGPFIGIYMGRKETTLIKKLRIFHTYVANYKDLNGVIFAFTLDTVNKADLTMSGYYYNPKRDVWEKATLPYPASIFRKNTYNTDWKEHFGSLYGDRIYNYKSINKWEMYDRLKQFPEVIKYLPHTSLYQTVDDVTEMLDKHGNVYVKPIEGKKGKGIYNIISSNNVITVKTREKNENVEWTFTNKDDFSSFLSVHLTKRKYIIQKTVELQIDNKVVDFRVGMDKDRLGNWQNFMFVSRVSGDNSIVSNRDISGGETKLIPDVLRDIYFMDEEMIEKHTKEFVSVAHTISKRLEETGLSLGKLAFDFAIDKNKDLWLIEVNSKFPDDSLMDEIDNKETYFKIRHTNMEYAKMLAGFKHENYHTLSITDNVRLELDEKIKLYIAMPKNEITNYRENILEKTKVNGLHVTSTYNEKLKKFVVELVGQREQIDTYLENIKQYDKIKPVVGLVNMTEEG
ncbi:YheC/YheD family endospore coat-associated protein [Ornithinibacillus halotolerans]|uniref:YheC/D-like protein n=1 Tax=Ornithinibacillus halotolerans TaxID=1274357 RepID=A0A916RS05_9BACI|nr:YheC/YheD family protein [Ornithinibacillus halotolerans]GGA64808.1 hypothetical protein GCM10008025_05770 [Ornithinibacillus halotolerans]